MATSSDGVDSSSLYKRLQGLTLVHSQALVNLVKEEVRTSQRVDEVRHRDSTQLVGALLDAKGTGAQLAIRNFFEGDEPKEFKEALDRLWQEKHDRLFGELKPVDIATDAKNYLGLFAGPEAKKVLGKEIAKFHQMEREPEPGWLIYDWELLRNFLAFRYRLNGSRSPELQDKKLANNLADLTYLAFASRVDAIATHDRTLIRPLAYVFAPNVKLIPPCEVQT
jgi:hypothetical protein